MSNRHKNYESKEPKKDLESLLSEIGGEMKVVVNRIQPRWCDGHLDTIEASEDDVLSLDDLRQQYGGRQLRIKIYDSDKQRIIAQRDIRFPDPPRENGVDLEPPTNQKKDNKSGDSDLLAMFMESQKTLAEQQAKTQQILADQQAKHSEAMLAMVQKQSDTTQRLLQDRLEEQKESRLNAPHSSLKETMELVEFLEGLKDRLKTPETTETNPMYKQIAEMANQILAFKLEQEKQKFTVQLQSSNETQQTPELPERVSPERKKSDVNEIPNVELMTAAAQRFKNLPLDQQKNFAELFFGQLNSGKPVSNGVDSEKVINRPPLNSETNPEHQPIVSVDLDSEDEDDYGPGDELSGQLSPDT